jgi:hypothetical protein
MSYMWLNIGAARDDIDPFISEQPTISPRLNHDDFSAVQHFMEERGRKQTLRIEVLDHRRKVGA